MPEYSNALIQESSPYLLQHAHNPVEWYAWNPQTLALAKERNLPILVSIGYAACHWCHVMEKESFENITVATYMNAHFTNIKIDREERPDIDHILMEAVQAMGVSGGWPLNVFLTPDLKPFYGGTYFPPERRHNHVSWIEILQAVSRSWNENKDSVQLQAENLFQHLQTASSKLITTSTNETDFEAITTRLLQRADTVWGGFGNAPKFPGWFVLQYLMQFGVYHKNDEAKKHVFRSLDNLISGGIYDQVGGGIARYSTDKFWLAPHFEKMLYDNAFLIQLLAEAYQLTNDAYYETYILKTISFLKREMLSADGGYYAALDADSEGVEGKFYVWSADEIRKNLDEDATAFIRDFGVVENGNWEGENILHYNNQFQENERSLVTNIPVKWEAALQKLLQERNKRVRPATDTKILLAWNALLLNAYCKAYAALQIESIKLDAIALFTSIQKNFKTDNGYRHVAGKENIPAFLDDYAYLIEAGISLHDITLDATYIYGSRSLAQYVIKHFYHAETGLFHYTESTLDDGLWQFRDMYDNAQPSGNSVMSKNLSYLGVVFPEEEWQEISEKMRSNIREATIKYPEAFSNWISFAYLSEVGLMEIEVLEDEFNKVFGEISKIYLPNKVFKPNIGSQKNRVFNQNLKNGGKFVVCNENTCLPPMSSTQELINYISKNLGKKST